MGYGHGRWSNYVPEISRRAEPIRHILIFMKNTISPTFFENQKSYVEKKLFEIFEILVFWKFPKKIFFENFLKKKFRFFFWNIFFGNFQKSKISKISKSFFFNITFLIFKLFWWNFVFHSRNILICNLAPSKPLQNKFTELKIQNARFFADKSRL